jgi:uncharacterized protein YacL
LSEQNGKGKMGDLVKFVDDNFRRTTFTDVFSVFPQILVILALLLIVLSVAFSTLQTVPILQWTPVLVSIVAILVAYYSFIMASRKYANKRLAYREAKRLGLLLADKSNEATCLLPPLVALKMENYPIELQVLYEVNKELFATNKLMENYYLS